MNRATSLFFKLMIGFFVTCGVLIMVGSAQTCPPPGIFYQLKVAGKILDEANNPRPNVTVIAPFLSAPATVETTSNADGSWAIFRETCILSPPRCLFILPGMERYFFQAGWAFSPEFFYLCESSTINVTARRAPFSAVSAASYQPVIASGAINSLFPTATNVTLANATQSTNQVPLPTTLAGTTLTIAPIGQNQATPVQLFFVSPTQVNFYLPTTVMLNTPVVTLNLKTGNGVTYTANALLQRIAPAFFTVNASGQGPASGVVARVHNGVLSYEDIVKFDRTLNRWVTIPIDLGPATDQVFLALFGTGFRAHTGLNNISAKVGGLNAQVTYAGEQPSFTGVDQTNILLPRTLAGRGEVDVALTVEGLAANLVKVAIK